MALCKVNSCNNIRLVKDSAKFSLCVSSHLLHNSKFATSSNPLHSETTGYQSSSSRPKRRHIGLWLSLGVVGVGGGLLAYSWNDSSFTKQVDSTLGGTGYYTSAVDFTRPYGQRIYGPAQKQINDWSKSARESATEWVGGVRRSVSGAFGGESGSSSSASKGQLVDDKKTVPPPLVYRSGRIDEKKEEPKPVAKPTQPPQPPAKKEPVAKKEPAKTPAPAPSQLAKELDAAKAKTAATGAAGATGAAAEAAGASEKPRDIPPPESKSQVQIQQQAPPTSPTPTPTPTPTMSGELSSAESLVQAALERSTVLARSLEQLADALTAYQRLARDSKVDTLPELKNIWALRAKRDAAEKAFTLALSDANKSVAALDERIVQSAAVDAETSSEPGLILGVTRLKQHLSDGNAALDKARDEMRRLDPLLTELVSKREALSKQLKNFVTADMKEEARAALELFVLQKAVQAGGGIVIGETNDALIVQAKELERLRAQLIEQAAAAERHERDALARQAGGYLEHLTRALQRQHEELSEDYEATLSEALVEERKTLEFKLAEWQYRLRGIEAALDGRATAIRQSRHSQQLFVACEALETAISASEARHLGSVAGSRSLVPIRGRVEQVLTVCDSLVAAPDVSSAEREAAHAIRLYVDGMPTLALERGLFTERELMDRFQRLVPICRNVALVPEAGGGIGSYVTSWLAARLTVRPRALVGDADDELPASWSKPAKSRTEEAARNYGLLASAERCMSRGDLSLAVRLMTALTGQARVAAADWLAEARALLAARQTAHLLALHAASMSLLNI